MKMDAISNRMVYIDNLLMLQHLALASMPPNPQGYEVYSHEALLVFEQYHVAYHREQTADAWRRLVAEVREVNIILRRKDSLLLDSDFEDELEWVEQGEVVTRRCNADISSGEDPSGAISC